jgi:hypothetical protein
MLMCVAVHEVHKSCAFLRSVSDSSLRLVSVMLICFARTDSDIHIDILSLYSLPVYHHRPYFVILSKLGSSSLTILLAVHVLVSRPTARIIVISILLVFC